jgi:hypothetical protein
MKCTRARDNNTRCDLILGGEDRSATGDVRAQALPTFRRSLLSTTPAHCLRDERKPHLYTNDRTMPSRKDAEAAGEHYGSVFSVSGPVIVAENLLGCAMYELV